MVIISTFIGCSITLNTHSMGPGNPSALDQLKGQVALLKQGVQAGNITPAEVIGKANNIIEEVATLQQSVDTNDFIQNKSCSSIINNMRNLVEDSQLSQVEVDNKRGRSRRLNL